MQLSSNQSEDPVALPSHTISWGRKEYLSLRKVRQLRKNCATMHVSQPLHPSQRGEDRQVRKQASDMFIFEFLYRFVRFCSPIRPKFCQCRSSIGRGNEFRFDYEITLPKNRNCRWPGLWHELWETFIFLAKSSNIYRNTCIVPLD